MTYSSHQAFWERVKETSHDVAWDIFHRLEGGIPSDIWEALPDEYKTTNDEGREAVDEESLIEWFDAMFDEMETGDWCDRIAEYADMCDMQMRAEAEEAKAPAGDTAEASH